MTLERVRRLFSSTTFEKLLLADWSLPSVEKAMPWFFTALGGFLAATLTSLLLASFLMPQHGKSKSGKSSSNIDGSLTASPINLPSPPLMADFKNIVARNLFNSEGAMADSNGTKVVCELRKSELPLKFTGVIFGGTSATSLVVIESSASKQAETFLLYDETPNQSRVVGIERSRVILERNGCQEYLELEAPPLPKRRVAGSKISRKDGLAAGEQSGDGFKEDGFVRSGNKIQVERRWVDRALGIDFAKTLQDAKANPNLVGGTEIKGFVLTKIRPNSVYEKMGLKDGDIVKAINGIELSGMAQAVQTLNQMRNETVISLSVERSGQTLNMNVDIRR